MIDLLTITQIIALPILLVCSAFFAGSETALMAVSRLHLKQLAKKHPKRVKTVEQILSRPEKLIGTILLGNNLVNIALSVIATAIAIKIWGTAGIIYVTIVLTIVILIFSDITPKVYAKYHNAGISLWSAPYLRVIMFIFNPIVIIVTFISTRLLTIMGIDIRKTKNQLVTEAEVKTLINLGWEDGAITSDEKNILSRVFTLNDKVVEDIMVPKQKVVVFNTDMSVERAINTVKKNGFSRYPVKRGRTDEIIAFIYARDLLGRSGIKKLGNLKRLLRPAVFTPSERKIDSQLRIFRTGKAHQAVVLNENGEFVGIITLEDIVEQMVGTIEGEQVN